MNESKLSRIYVSSEGLLVAKYQGVIYHITGYNYPDDTWCAEEITNLTKR